MTSYTHAQLIAAMLCTAHPITKHYWTDLAHDARTIANAECGDTFLWAPYESGSRLICLWRGDKPNTQAASLAAAMITNRSDVSQWYRVSISVEDSFGLDPVTTEDAVAECWSATRTAEIPGRASVSQIHM